MFTILNFFFFITAKSNLTWIVVGGGRRALLVRSFLRSFVDVDDCHSVCQSVYGDTSTPGRTRNACIFLIDALM